MSADLTEPRAARDQPGQLALKGTLLVHVPTRGSPDALRIAIDLAKRSGARLIGVGAEAFEPAVFASQPYMDGSLISLWIEALDERIRGTKASFEAETTALGERAIWRGETAFPHEALARHACGADWIVAVRPAGLRPSLAPPIADLIMRAGLPVLVAPQSAAPMLARRIVVGWNDTREAARAVTDAMPLLAAAERVVVVTVGSDEIDQREQTSLDDVRQRLAHRGCSVVSERHTRGEKAVAEVLAASANGHGADLIVVGGYAHSRLQEWVTGGVTRDLISDCQTYVLFSH